MRLTQRWGREYAGPMAGLGIPDHMSYHDVRRVIRSPRMKTSLQLRHRPSHASNHRADRGCEPGLSGKMPSMNGHGARRTMAWLPGILLLAGVGAGCVTSGGAFNETGYRQSVFGYQVAFRDAKAKSLAGPDWQIDSHRKDSINGGWEEKTGTDYVAVREEDLNQDGSIGIGERTDETIYDLKLLNKKDNGVIWTKAHPLLPENAETDLEVILDNYVDALAGNGRYAQSNLFGVERVKARNYTTFLVDKKIEKVGSGDALAGTIEIAEVDRLKSDPAHRSGVIRVLLVKFRCFTFDNCRRENPDVNVEKGKRELDRWPLVDCRGKQCRARAGLLVVGYYNTPAYFAAGLPEIDDLLKRVSFPEAGPLPISGLREAKKDKPAAPAAPAAPAPEADPASAPAPPAAVVNEKSAQ
jgi:hypothetical protein